MIHISHELPKTLFDSHDLINDYPYILCHLLEDESYFKFYEAKCKQFDFSILDNSAFELGLPVDPVILNSWTRKINPSHVVMPDLLHNLHGTLRNAHAYIKAFSDEPTLLVGVVQGDSYQELEICLRYYLEQNLKLIAVPFDCLPSPCVTYARFQFIDRLVREGYNGPKLHLLGCDEPTEFLAYKKQHKAIIHSVDTSSPIMRGLEGQSFLPFTSPGAKPSAKLAENINMPAIDKQTLSIIYHNCKTFRQYLGD